MSRYKVRFLAGVLAVAMVGGLLGAPEGSGLSSLAAAAERKAVQNSPKAEKNEPTDVTADSMELFENKNLIIFVGNVKAVQGETTLLADRLEVHTEKVKNEKGEEETRMREWIATGNVRIIKPNMTITGEKAIMDMRKDIVTVEGGVVVKKPDATIRGEKLVANLKTNVTRVLSARGKKRVHGIFR